MKYKSIEEQVFWEDKIIECKDTGEKVVGYKNYLKTKHWKYKRISIYRKYDRRCTKCGEAFQLIDSNVHHLTYERVGNELDEDLVLLCKECHKKVHGIETKHRQKKSWKEKTWKKKT